MYNKSTARLRNIGSGVAPGTTFDPEEWWDGAKHQEYQDRLLPEFFICPFERGRGRLERRGPVSDTVKKIDYYEEHGRYEGYQTAMWAFNVIRNQVVDYPWPGGAGPAQNGVAKYSTINWNLVNNGNEPNVGSPKRDALLRWLHRRWKDNDSRERVPGNPTLTRGGGGLSQLVPVFCAQGEHMIFSGKSGWLARDNMGSHRTTLGGGTNIIFGDGHVEWVLGTRMGWP
jgi:prepilin-type processing-associated H-X9-DG protein